MPPRPAVVFAAGLALVASAARAVDCADMATLAVPGAERQDDPDDGGHALDPANVCPI